MGATRIVLDPSGYNRVSEPGFHWMITGRQLLEEHRRRSQSFGDVGRELAQTLFMGFPGLDWITLQPSQLYPDNSLSHELTDNDAVQFTDWVFATGLGEYEYDALARPDGSGTRSRYWVAIPQTPDPVLGLDNYDFAAMGTRTGVDGLDGYGTIAVADTLTQFSPDVSTYAADYCPSFFWLDFPRPRSTVVWGFADFAVIVSGESITIARDIIRDGQTWEVVGRGTMGNSRRSVAADGNLGSGLGGVFGSGSVYLQERGIVVMPAGPEHLCFIPSGGDPILVRVRQSVGETEQYQLLNRSSWYVAAGPKQRLAFRMELTTYNNIAGFLNVGPPDSGEALFALPSGYAPISNWTLLGSYMFSAVNGDSIVRAYDPILQMTTATSTLSGESLGFGIFDTTGTKFQTNGVNHEGGATLYLKASTASRGLCPQFCGAWVRFPPALSPRVNSALVIGDTYYQTISMSSSLRDPDGKEIEVEMLDGGVGILTASGLDARGSYPIEVQEDTTGLGTWTVRARGWLAHPDMIESHAENALRANPIRSFSLRAKGLLSRGNDENGKWLYLPQMVDPSSLGTISHAFVVGESLRMMGVDTTNTSEFVGATDPFLGTNLANLPGTWSRNLSTPGYEIESPWAPDWDESKLDYANRIAREWRGWLLFELLSGLIRYRSDLQTDVTEDGLSYSIAATIYKDRATATAAGVTGQYWMTARRWIEDPKANVVRVSGPDADGQSRESIIERDTASITTIAYRNFLGEEKVRNIVSKMAIDVTARIQLARMALRRWKRRRIYWEVVVPLAHWQIGVDVGDVVTLQNRGDYLLTRVTTQILKRDTYRCTLLGERLD